MDYDTNIFMHKDSEFVSLQVITANCMKQFVRVYYTRKNLCQCANKKYQYQKFRITGLKSSLKATEKYAYCLDYLHFPSRYGFPKLNAAVLIDKTQKYRQEFFQMDILIRKRETKALQFDVCCEVIDQISTVVVGINKEMFMY